MEQPQSSPLYTLDTHSTEKLYRKKYFTANRWRLGYLTVCVCVVSVLAYNLVDSGWNPLLFGLFMSFLFLWNLRLSVNASYKNSQHIQTGLTHYAFYEDSFSVQSSSYQAFFRYQDLCRISVRRHSIVLKLSSWQCFTLLDGEYPSELADFLRDHSPSYQAQNIRNFFLAVLRVAFNAFVILCVLIALRVLPHMQRETTPKAPSHTSAASAPEESPQETFAPDLYDMSSPAPAPSAEESSATDPITAGYQAIYDAYLKESTTTYTFKLTAKGEDYIILNDTPDAVEFLQYDRDSENGSCALYVYERCPKDASGSWSRENAQILNIYAYRYWDGTTAASGKTSWGGASADEYSELTGE